MPAPTRYEYKVVPAPRRGEKVRGAKQTEDRFAHVLASLMNKLGREGWDYLRAETLPCEERTGFRGRTTTFQNMLVFRRVIESDDQDTVREAPRALRSEAPEAPPARDPAKASPAEPVVRRDPVPASQKDGPRLVSSRADEGGKAPVLGSAKGETTAD